MKTSLIFPLLWLSLWSGLSYLGLVSPVILPTPIQILEKLMRLIFEDTFIGDIGWTFGRTGIGFIIAGILGITTGLIIGYSPTGYDLASPTLNFLRSIPVSALFTVFLLIFGIGEGAKIIAATWASFFTLAVSTAAGVQSGKKLRLQAARLLKLKPLTIFWRIIFPEALPHIFTGLRVSYALAFIVVIVSEMTVGTKYGLGKRIVDAQLTYDTTTLYITIFITGLIGYLTNQVFLWLENKIIFWKGK